MSNLPPPSLEKNQFTKRWSSSLRHTVTLEHELRHDIKVLHGLLDALYESVAREWPVSKGLKRMSNRMRDKITPAQQIFWDHPLAKRLFKIWDEHIYKTKERGVSTERADFLDEIEDYAEISRNPKHAELYQHYKDLTLGLSALCPNSVAHLYIREKLEQHPTLVKEYFRLALITGEYNLLLERFPPYYQMLNLHTRPGISVFFDTRMDFRLMLPLEQEYTLAVPVPRTQVRQAGRYIEIPASTDSQTDQIKHEMIDKLQADLKAIFPDRCYLSAHEFGGDAKVYFTGNGVKQEIPDYFKKRTRYIETESRLNLLKAIPTPSITSGIRVNFKLRDPVAVLLDGLDRKRPFDLKEVCYVLRCLEAYGSEVQKDDQGQRQKLETVIDAVFEDPGAFEYSESTQTLLRDLDRIHAENAKAEDAWRYLLNKLLEAKHKLLLSTLCHCLTQDGFDVFFSLKPLLEIHNNTDLKLVYILRTQLSFLLHEIFSDHIDVSACTQHKRSEPQLAKMAVEQCLTMHFEPDHFMLDLGRRLREQNKENQTCKHYMYNHAAHGTDENTLQEDLNGILKLISRTRGRLLSLNHFRTLCFIDPSTVEVMKGNFSYFGSELKQEHDSILHHKRREKEFADHSRHHEEEVKKLQETLKAQKAKLEAIDSEREFNLKHAELKIQDLETDIQKAIIAGDTRKMLGLMLYKEYKQGGASKVAKVIADTPEFIDILQPHRKMWTDLTQLLNDNPMLVSNGDLIRLIEMLTMHCNSGPGEQAINHVTAVLDDIKTHDTKKM